MDRHGENLERPTTSGLAPAVIPESPKKVSATGARFCECLSVAGVLCLPLSLSGRNWTRTSLKLWAKNSKLAVRRAPKHRPEQEGRIKPDTPMFDCHKQELLFLPL